MKLVTTAITTLAVPKLIDYAGELWDDFFDDDDENTVRFTLDEISKIKKCRQVSNETDEHLAYELNQHLGINLTIKDYRSIW